MAKSKSQSAKDSKPPPKKSKSKQNKTTKKASLKHEIICIGVIAFGLLVILSLFTSGGAGIIGAIIRSLLIGLFGIGAYVLPFFLIIGSVYAFLKRAGGIKVSKFVFMTIGFLLLITLVHIMGTNNEINEDGFFSYLASSYADGSIDNGGLFGAIFSLLFVGLIGRDGSYIVIIAALLVLVIILTGKSFFGAISRAYSTAGEAFNKYSDEEDDEYIDDNINDDDEPYYRRQEQETMFGRKKINKNKEVKTFIIDENKDTEDYIDENIELDAGIHLAMSDLKNKPVGGGSKSTQVRNSGKLNRLDIISDDEIDQMRMENEQMQVKLAGLKEFDEEREALPDLEECGNNEQDIDVDENVYEGVETAKEIEEGFLAINEYKRNPVNKEKQDAGSSRKIDEDDIHIEISSGTEQVPFKKIGYIKPPIDLLSDTPDMVSSSSRAAILENSKKLESTLKSFGVEAKVVSVSQGPAVTRYELSPGQGVKVSKISGLADDLALNLAAVGIRIEAPIPGKSVVGIEIPNKEVMPVYLKEVLDDEEFKNFPSKLAVALGKDIAGNTVIADIAKMPHLLIAGATGSGKSVCINTIVISLLYNSSPDEVKLLMIDPKVVELSIYNGIPHLLIPVVTDPKKAAGALNWGVQEMINRYKLFAEANVRDLKGYNRVLKERDEEILPQIVIIVDELSDLMMVAANEVEDAICRLAQMARAAGIHLIIATQRPSVDVITGLIKANVPSRLAFAVSSSIDSRTILDSTGAEKLLGKGDMLFNPVGLSKPQRVQGAFISDKEVESIVDFLKVSCGKEYDSEMIDRITAPKAVEDFDGESDELFEEAVGFVISKEKASASMLQRQFRIGYNRAARLIEEMETRGVVGPEDGSKPRKVLMGSYNRSGGYEFDD